MVGVWHAHCTALRSPGFALQQIRDQNMYGAVLGLMTCAGAWIAWRRHPLYSARSSFRMLGEISLLIAACICIIVLSVRLTEHSSFAVQLGSMLAVVVVLTLGMIFSITAIQTPKSAQLHTALPPTVPLLNLYRRNVLPWAKAAAVFFAISGLLCLIPGDVSYISASILALGGLLAAIMFPTAYFTARKLDRAATALQLHPWMHWHYTQEAWQAWTQTRVERMKAQPAAFELKRDWRRIASVCAGVVAGTLILTPGDWGDRVAWAVLCCALILAWTEIAAWEARRAPQKLRKQLARSAPDTYFGPDGMLCDGAMATWLGVNVYLVSVSVDAIEPRSLCFSFEKIVPNPYGSAQTVTISQSVLIPPGCDPSDLSLLRTALAARCPSAKIAIP